MYYVIAVINEESLDDVVGALLENQIFGISISEIRGFGNLRLPKDFDHVDLHRKAKLEIAVSNDHFRELTVDLIMKHANNGKAGAGKIFVLDMKEVYRVRTGEAGAQALN